jgi:hypothetical protein
MATHQIEATIEKLEQDSIQLKGAGKYLFEKSSEKKKDEDKKYWNIFELKSDDESSIKLESVEYNKPIYFTTKFKDLLIQAFIEKKKLKFDLENKGGKYTITAVSHAST